MYLKWFVIFIQFISMELAVAEQCSHLFPRQKAAVRQIAGDIDSTQDLLDYIAQLDEARELQLEWLEIFARELQQGHLINPIPISATTGNSKIFLFRQHFSQMLESSQFDHDMIISWLDKRMQSANKIEEQREKAKTTTVQTAREIRLIPIEPDTFSVPSIRDSRRKIEIKFTHPLWVMDTPVTQKQWLDVMDENPSLFSYENDLIDPNYRGPGMESALDRPVENISWWSAIVFANELSKRHGLQEVYDLRGIEFKSVMTPRGFDFDSDIYVTVESSYEEILVMAARGILAVRDPLKWPKIHGAKGDTYGDLYGVNGFRLLTHAEQIYLRWDKSKGSPFLVKQDQDKLGQHAWYFENSKESTKPVGLLQPRLFNENPIFDLFGNVDEFCFDFHSWDLPSGVNPVTWPLKNSSAIKTSRYHVNVIGGAYTYLLDGVLRAYGQKASSQEPESFFGLRLGRTQIGEPTKR